MAPEVLGGKKYDHKADIWSLGALFYEMITGFTPFTGMNQRDLQRNLTKGEYKFPKSLKLSLEGLNFLNSCLQYDPEKRISWDQLKNHPYIVEHPLSKENQELFLSYCDKTGEYTREDHQQLMRNPYKWMNDQNAVKINAKDPEAFMKMYNQKVNKFRVECEA